MSFAADGLTAAQKDKMAQVAMEAGYASVWGAYPWSCRRGTTTLTTSGGVAYTALPSDFEACTSIRYLGSGNPWLINVMEEVAFDTDFPYPGAFSSAIPRVCKIVYETPQAANRFRIVWYPVPDAAYSMALSYNRRADTAFLPNVPSWMLDPIVQRAGALMFSQITERLQYDMLADRAVLRAMSADQPVVGVGPMYGADPGWNDWDTKHRGSSVWDPHSST